MADSDLEGNYPELLQALRRESRSCPASDRLIAHAEGKLPPDEAKEIATHLALCEDCRLEHELVAGEPGEPDDIDEITWRRARQGLDRRPAPWQAEPARRSRRGPMLAIAATLLVLVGGGSYWLMQRAGPSRDDAIRGPGLVADEPAGDVAQLTGFAWSQAAPLRASYVVEVAHGETILWRGALDSGGLPDEIGDRLEPDVRYRWRVTAIADTGSTLATSGWTAFRILERGPAPSPEENGEDRQEGDQR